MKKLHAKQFPKSMTCKMMHTHIRVFVMGGKN